MQSKMSLGLLLSSTVCLTLLTSDGSAMLPEEREPVYLKISPHSMPISLPDGSELTQSNSQVWLKTPGQTHYATSWEAYAQAKGLNMKVIVAAEAGMVQPELRVIRGCGPFKLFDGSEGVVNPSNQFWVKMPGQNHYATSWNDYVTKTHCPIAPVIAPRPKALVKLRITRANPLFVFTLPDGSEVHTNSANRVWVKTPQQAFPATRWEDYAYSRKLNIWPKIKTGTSDSVELCIMRNSIAFSLGGGHEVAVNGANEVWVKKPSQSYYATPFKDLGLKLIPVVTDKTMKRPFPTPVPFYSPHNALLKGYKAVFETNQQACQNGYETFSGKILTPVDLEVNNLQAGSKKYKHHELPAATTNNHITVYEVTNQDSFVAAHEMMLRGLSPCVANAANESRPGGGVANGAQAQEEELCKRATLYKGLLPALYPMQHDELIYNPDVMVFMNPVTYSFMDNPYKLSVITQAYICLPGSTATCPEPEQAPQYKTTTSDKLRAQLRLAALQGHDSVVLAAVGCGAFSGGRPGPVSAVVARIAREVIESEFKGVFKEIRVAILSKGINLLINDNFSREFGQIVN